MADILIIEDDGAIRELVKVHLSGAGHDVREAADGQSGVAAALQSPPDLIVLDINMPVMDGTRVMKTLGENDQTRTVPVIALSAMNVPEMRDDMHGLGCAAYVTKPVNFDVFMAHVAELTA